MPRYKLVIEYDGTNFAGWQIQNNAYSVQQCIEEAIFKFSKQKVKLVVAGRTDAGVHATGQVAHFDLDRPYKNSSIISAINYFVKPNLVVVVSCEEVTSEFHARFSALQKTYQYVVINRKTPLALELNRAWLVKESLDLEKMRQAAQILLGTHDFTSFRATLCQAKSPIRTMDRIDIHQLGDHIYFTFTARSFLHHMIRNFVGSLKLVGNEYWEVGQIGIALQAKARAAGGPTAPAAGLYLQEVVY